MRKRIATEILTTERSYVKSMQTVLVFFKKKYTCIPQNAKKLQGLLKHVKEETKSLNDMEFYTVFANLPEVRIKF